LKFTYKDYENMLEHASKKGYGFGKFNTTLLPNPTIYLRHDADLSPDRAHDMACLEYNLGVKSTYFFMDLSPMYDLYSRKTISIIEHITSMGHSVGRHLTNEQVSQGGLYSFSSIFTTPVFSIHMPHKRYFGNNMLPINTYNDDYFNKALYISDSTGKFRFNDPLEEMDINRNPQIHLSCHPLWYGSGTKRHKIDSILEGRILELREYAKEILC